jgi:protein TonB
MFDLITGQTRHMPRNQSVPILISTTAQVVIVGIALAVPYLYLTEQLPEIPTMLAFVAAPSPPPPPPPPPAPAPQAAAKPAPVPPKPGQLVAPVDAPPIVAPELVAAVGDDDEGVPGGVEGGVPGGVYGGVVGGIPDVMPPPPPPPPPAQPRGPVRVGGQLKAPELIRRVDPEYPQIAMAAQYEGLVILEAIVNEDGHVDDVRVLRSAGLAGALDRAAVIAVRQWQYSPLLLNGRRTSFLVTVTLSFTISDKK